MERLKNEFNQQINEQNYNVANIVNLWDEFFSTSDFPKLPQSSKMPKSKFEELTKVLEQLILYVNENRRKKDDITKGFIKKADSLIYILSLVIEDYEKEHFNFPGAEGHEVLELLMDQHGLTQADLKKELGGQSVVSDILNGKRELNKRQIKELSKRFNVNPSCFL